MTTEISERVARVLEADCGHSLHPFMQRHCQTEIDALTSVIRQGQCASAARMRRAIFLLGRIGAVSAAGRIASVLDDLDEGGRIAAADALGRLDAPGARRATLWLSRDHAPQVRKFAALALDRLGGAAARDRLCDMARCDAQPFLRAYAQRLLDRRKATG